MQIFQYHACINLNFYHHYEQLYNIFIYLNKYVWHDIVSME
jgi:hypothetical protein